MINVVFWVFAFVAMQRRVFGILSMGAHLGDGPSGLDVFVKPAVNRLLKRVSINRCESADIGLMDRWFWLYGRSARDITRLRQHLI